MDIVCLSSAYWDEPLWTNKQHVMSRLAHSNRVLYLDPPLSWIGLLRNRKSVRGPWGRSFPALRTKMEGLSVLSFPVLPLERFDPVSRMNLSICRFFLNRAVRKLHMTRPVIWVYNPLFWKIADNLPRSLLCYDCVDDFSAFPIYKKIKQRVIREEERLCRAADLVFTTSQRLYTGKKTLNPATYLVSNVADFNHFHQAGRPGVIPEDLKKIPAPRLVFAGAVSSYKLDFALLRYLAEKRPSWQIILIGPVGDGEYVTDLAGVESLPNVHLLGFKPYTEIPDFLRGADVLLLPYRISEYTESMMPLKFHEFMATGKPLVSTPLPALAGYRSLLAVGENHGEFLAAVEKALSGERDEMKTRRIETARENDWEKRISTLLRHVREAVEKKRQK